MTRTPFALSIAAMAISFLGCESPHDSSWHWNRIREYTEFINNPKNLQHDEHGFAYVTDPPDIMPSLYALDRKGEIIHIDLVFPNVPKTEEVTRYWLEYVNAAPEIIYATANPSYVDYKTKGVEPFHMNIWFKPTGKQKFKRLIAGIEDFGANRKALYPDF